MLKFYDLTLLRRFIIMVISVQFTSCWTFESNITTIAALPFGFKINKDSENPSDGNQLVFDIDNQNTSLRIIQENCIFISYDSNKILIKSQDNKFNTNYKYSILQLNTSISHFNEIELSKKEFEKRVATCLKCTQLDLIK